LIPYGRQSIDDDDVDAVVEVLRSDFLTTGPAVERFEAALCEATGARFAVAVANGTAALHAACAAASIGPGQTVATSALTFNASAACVAYVGGTPALVDIDPDTWNLDLARLPSGLDGIVAVHYAGMPLDLSVLPYRPRVVIEDASHALGAIGPDGPVGNCARSDMCTFSFHPVKPITTAEGGAVTTNDPALAERLRRFRNHGIERMPDQGGWYYEVVELGYNYRLNDLQAALGASQIRRLESFVDRRNQLAQRYRTLLSGVRLPPEPTAGQRHGRHLFPVWLSDRDRAFALLRERGIGVQVHYVPLYRHPVWAALGWSSADYPVTEEVYAGLVSLPLHPSLTEGDQDRVIAAIASAAA
jgi:dTDP-4-amino-4,6-dideoxygalactose transaminase